MYLFTNHSSYSACIMVLPLHLLYPTLSSQLCIGDDLRWMRNGFSVRHKDRRGTSHTIPCLYIMLWNEFNIAEIRNYGFGVLRYGASISHVNFLYFRNGWKDCRDVLMLFFTYTEHTYVATSLWMFQWLIHGARTSYYFFWSGMHELINHYYVFNNYVTYIVKLNEKWNLWLGLPLYQLQKKLHSKIHQCSFWKN